MKTGLLKTILFATGIAILLLPGRLLGSETMDPRITRALEETVRSNLEWERIEISDIRIDRGSAVPGTAEVEVVSEQGGKPLGKRRFVMLARYPGGSTTFGATANVNAFGRVYYLARPLARGERVRPENLVVREVNVRKIRRGAVSDPEEIQGLAAARSIGVSTVLKQSYFKNLPLAKKGDRVLLTAEGGAVQVVVPGVLREDAYPGRPVRVTNMMSKREVEGWLINAGTVKVVF